ncbi:putative MFS transporter [Xylariaceae sp. FL1019]|nr:putative MFS transporter [Xylariaceae sp. FL1019]
MATTHQNGGSSTAVMELQTMSPLHLQGKDIGDGSPPNIMGMPMRQSSTEGHRLSSGSLPSPITATEVKERWNYPRANVPKVAACFYSMFVMGANDAAYGPIIPYLQEYYHLSYLIVSLLFLSPFVGYTLAAFLNSRLHLSIGQRGVSLITCFSHLVAYIVIAVHPPYPVLVVAFALAGFGNGVADAAWNAFVGNLDRANELLGFLHGLYGAGAVVSPLVATAFITKVGLPWYSFYYLMIGLAGLELVSATLGFWSSTAKVYREHIAHSAGDSPESGLREALFHKPGARVTWLCSIFLLGYVGLEVSLGGWIVEFMIQVRHGGAFESGLTATGFWLGLTVGRVVLGFVTPRIGEKLAIMIYLPIAMGLELLFWLVPQFIVSAVAIGLQGFFIGPLFPAAIIAMSKLLPRHLHVGAIGFAAAFGGSGAAVLPFAVGAIAQAKGVQVLQPIILALLAAIFIVWCGLPRIGKKKE